MPKGTTGIGGGSSRAIGYLRAERARTEVIDVHVGDAQ